MENKVGNREVHIFEVEADRTFFTVNFQAVLVLVTRGETG